MLAKELLSDWPAERWSGRRLLVGVSGGADSVALLLALHDLLDGSQLVVAHLNHGWRGIESDQDQAFVVKLCSDLGVKCQTHLLQNCDSLPASQSDAEACCEDAMLAKEMNDGVVQSSYAGSLANDIQVQRTEEKARLARYRFFKETAYACGASYVVTAHTADDRIETVVHNLLRGTGLAGAASLVMVRPFDQDLVLVRPLLRKRRRDIEAFLTAQGQTFREDSSNALLHYRRNFLRSQVLPLMAQQYQAAPESLLNFSELAEQVLADLNLLAGQWLDRVGYQPPAQMPAFVFTAPQTAFGDTPWSVVHAALRQVWLEAGWPQGGMSRAHWQALRELTGSRAGVINLPGGLRAESRDGLVLVSSSTVAKNL